MEFGGALDLDRCPHCAVSRPNLFRIGGHETKDGYDRTPRMWGIYRCAICGGVVSAEFPSDGAGNVIGHCIRFYPELRLVSNLIPDRCRKRLIEAVEAIHAPGASIMSCASGIDWMLKDKGYDQGMLFNRIEQAAAAGLLTDDMKEWAHVVRLEANAERHADPDYIDPTTEDAKRTLDFALALAEILYVLPERANQGRQAAQQGNP